MHLHFIRAMLGVHRSAGRPGRMAHRAGHDHHERLLDATRLPQGGGDGWPLTFTRCVPSTQP